MSVYADEHYKVYTEIPRKARKAHECCACDTPIRPGDHYTEIHLVYEGAETLRRCARCQAIHEYLRELSRESDSDEWPADRLDCGREFEERWDRQPPPWLAELAFWVPGDPIPPHHPCNTRNNYNGLRPEYPHNRQRWTHNVHRISHTQQWESWPGRNPNPCEGPQR